MKKRCRIREELGVNCMDLPNWLIGLHKELKVDIPEADYPGLATLDDCIDYPANR